jgi:glutamate-1-semialdehyde 2,1-aminomutase
MDVKPAVNPWGDATYEEISQRLKAIVSQPPRLIPRPALEGILDEYEKRNPRSKALYAEAKQLIPGGVEHNLAFNFPFPLTMDRSAGCHLWDADGNRYIDFLLCGAPILLGHNYPALRDAIIEVIREKGPSTGLSSEYEILAAREIIERMPAAEMVRFLQSGTEAVMAAIRVARVATHKAKLIKVGGSYHGWSDQVVYDLHIPGTGSFEAHGIPREARAHTLAVRPNDTTAVEELFEKSKNQGGIAAVLVEPIGGESGTHPVAAGFNAFLRQICDAYGALLIFDEVVTGFRVARGGAQELFGVSPDLTILGKIVGHGYPSAGALAGRRQFMELCSSGIQPGMERAYVGGTLAANPITCAATYHALRLSDETDAVQKAAQAATRLTAGLNGLFSDASLPFYAYHCQSITHIATSAPMAVELTDASVLPEIMQRNTAMQEYGAAMSVFGVNLLAGSRAYTCLAHDKEAIDAALQGFQRLVELVTAQ